MVMGIRGLTSALNSYGTLATLSNESVVIDGPALVHRIWESCNRNQKMNSAILGQLSYGFLGAAIVEWLEQLRNENVIVRKIFFDGYLPPRKWEVRRERLLKQSHAMKVVSSMHEQSVEIPDTGHADNLKFEISLNYSSSRKVAKGKIPKHPFLVPAVIEYLRNSPNWCSVVQLVPGEADAFCAQDVKENGGSVFTSDSDLLVEELGATGAVIFFDNVKKGMALKFIPAELEEKFQLQKAGGMARLGYEISRSKTTTLHMALLKARTDNYEVVSRLSEYQEFLDEHIPEDYISQHHPVVSIISALDPRISELVIQSLNIDVVKPMTELSRKKGVPRGPEELSMFLPIMIEHHNKKSSWSMSEPVRRLAYAIAQQSQLQRRDTIIEYRTLETMTGGRQLSIPNPDEMAVLCDRVQVTLRTVDEQMRTQHRWTAFAICLDIDWSSSENKEPISATLVQQALRVSELQPTEYSWDLIHWTAQVQASFYSLRMLKQVIDVVKFLAPTSISRSQEKLRQRLSDLPNIAEYPNVEAMYSTLSAFGKTDGPSAIFSRLGLPKTTFRETPEPPRIVRYIHTDAGRVTKAKSTTRRRPLGLAHNPFAVLSADD